MGQFGFAIHHQVSTEYGSSGSPVTSKSGFVVGIHLARSLPDEENFNIAVKFENILWAIEKSWRKRNTKIANDDIALKRLGAVKTRNKNLCTNHLQNLWFYRTRHTWFLTETKPVDPTDLSDIQDCDWQEIDPKRTLYFSNDFKLSNLDTQLLKHLEKY